MEIRQFYMILVLLIVASILYIMLIDIVQLLEHVANFYLKKGPKEKTKIKEGRLQKLVWLLRPSDYIT